MKRTGMQKFTIFLIVFAVSVVSVASVYAAYVLRSGLFNNIFSPADSVDPKVEEVFDPSKGSAAVKENVKVSVGNTGYPVYVRVEILVTWQQTASNTDKGTVYYEKPVQNIDYEIKWANLTAVTEQTTLKDVMGTGNWIQLDDGFYYYLTPVASEGSTNVLIESCKQLGTARVPEGYALSVEIIVQTVQAVGTTDVAKVDAWKDAWGITDAML